MTIYEKVINELHQMRTIVNHIKKLGSLLPEIQDSKLKSILEATVTNLQRAHASPRVKTNSTPGNLYNPKEIIVMQLIQYCESAIGTKKPEWQVEAERNNWGPKQ
ncbi:hypothetical protein [Pseudomonas sp. Z13]|uniref:hypothetical protein n=1 Tax=Pseudomonas sp. Z13 TaxID=2983409 RepID=UPI002E808087|nr:hypothetical protein [Pseudomonas sp. Z13]